MAHRKSLEDEHLYPMEELAAGQNNSSALLEAVGRAETTTSLVELSLSCLDLPDCDLITKSDPQVLVYQLDVAGPGTRSELGRTEVIQDNLNPKFAKKILMHYNFEQVQKLLFEVYDIDPIGDDDFLGSCETTLADIVTSRSANFKQPLLGGPRKRPGYLVIDVEELIACKQVISFLMKALDLPSSFCGTFRPSASVHIYRSNENGSLTIVHRTPAVHANGNPNFKPLNMKLVTLCNGDLDRSIRFEIFNERFNLNKSLGFFDTTVNSLKLAGRQKEALVFNLMHGINRKRRDEMGQTSGGSNTSSQVVISDFKIITQATFLDYIRAGAQIHFVIAIDFTASNGDPSYPDSLHYLDPMGKQLNPYESALTAVGDILRPYDTVGMFAGFGFGAKLYGSNKAASHLFPLNGNDQHPYVKSVDELVKVYRNKISNVILSGPTNFAPCIAHCNRIAKDFEDGNHYFVLLIVTDGIISDMHQTKKAIIEASKSPLSIIICGVGNAEFSAMNELDSDDIVMTVDGKSAERDIVQFVPMNQFLPAGMTGFNSAHRNNDTAISKSPGLNQSQESRRLLAEEVLREIPDQLTGYMISKGFHPELTYPDNG